jgi:hypothetical protein
MNFLGEFLSFCEKMLIFFFATNHWEFIYIFTKGMLVQNKIFNNYFGGKVYEESVEINYPPKKTFNIYI